MLTLRRLKRNCTSWISPRHLHCSGAQLSNAGIKVDRDRAGQFGLTMADVVRSVVPATSSSRFTDPNYWRDPNTGNAFQIQVQLPQNRVQGLGALSTLPLGENGETQPQLDQVALVEQRVHARNDRTLQRPAGGQPHGEHPWHRAGQAVQKINDAFSGLSTPPKGTTVMVRGQIPALEETICGLRGGLLLALCAIFLLLMANFQSMRLPLAILSTIPGVFVRRGSDASPHRNHSEHSIVHGSDYGCGDFSREFDPARQLCRTFRREDEDVLRASHKGARAVSAPFL